MRHNFSMQKVIKAALVAMCFAVGAGAVLNLIILGLQVASMASQLPSMVSWDTSLFIVVLTAKTALDVVVFVLFAMFAMDIARRRRFFSKLQSARLGLIGICFLAHVALGLVWPYYPATPFGDSKMVIESVAPHLDLRLLAFACMFFALAGIFEYGRILQEDSDSIL